MITQLDRTENDCRNKMDAADAQYKIQQKKTIQTHAEYYESHLPKVLKVRFSSCTINMHAQLIHSNIGIKSSR